MEKVEIQDLLNYRFVHSLAASAKHILCLQTQMDKEENGYRTNLMELNPQTGQLKTLIGDGQVSSFCFENEDTVLFAAERKFQDKPEKYDHKTVYYRLSLNQGEAQKAFEIPYTVLQLLPVADSDWVVLKIQENLHALDPKTASKEELEDAQDYVILHEVPFVANGAGFIDSDRCGCLAWNKRTGEQRRITPPGYDCGRIIVEGHRVIYTGKNWRDVMPKTSELVSYDLDTQSKQTLVSEGQLRIGAIAAENQVLMFMATDMAAYGNGTSCDFYRCDLNQGSIDKVLDYEYSVGSCVNSDVRYGSGKTFLMKDGALYFTTTVGYHTELMVLRENQLEKAVAFNGAVSGFDFIENGLVFCAMEPGQLQEIYIADGAGNITGHTHISEVCLKDKAIQSVEYAGFVNSAGQSIDGWLIKPVGWQPDRKYPAILDIHGGPRTTYGELLSHEMQVWASAGYYVFFCNHRGSDGYGDAFADLRLKYGTIDYEDIMEFTDHILARNSQIDPLRLGVTGGSYGGYMTNWIITHTHRFAAAASQRSISDWISDYGTSGISYDDDLHDGGKPWDQMEKMWDHSPLKYADFCETPTLFIHSFEDYTCAVSQAMEMFTALKILNVETRACLFKGENHELSRSGKPMHRFKRLREITDWMNKHCQE